MRVSNMGAIQAYEYQKHDQNGYARKMRLLKEEPSKKPAKDSLTLEGKDQKMNILTTADGSVSKLRGDRYV